LQTKDVAKAFYGIVNEDFQAKFDNQEFVRDLATEAALAIDEIILSLVRVDFQNQIDISKKMIHLIGDYLIDEIRDKHSVSMTFEEIDNIAERCVNVAKIRYKQ
jgi:type I restriction enzyme R subunit